MSKRKADNGAAVVPRESREDRQLRMEEFVRIFQAAGTLDEVAEKMEMPRIKVGVIASRLRKNGVPLQKMRKLTTAGLDYTSLKDIAVKHG
jgi:hypothetical protein